MQVLNPDNAPSAAGFEFDAEQNAAISRLARVMLVTAVLTLVGSVLSVLVALYVPPPRGSNAAANMVGVAVGILLNLVTGVWTLNASRAFQRVVDSQGEDIPNMMSALNNVRRYFTLMKWLIIIALVFFALALGLGVMGALALSQR